MADCPICSNAMNAPVTRPVTRTGTACELVACSDRCLDDRAAILAHIDSIFGAYMSKDLKTIRDTHTDDRRGFQIKSDHIVRGVDEYMANAVAGYEHFQPLRYEITETEVQVYGDTAIVYYVASYTVEPTAGGEHTMRLRAVDVYRRRDADWIQAGSNICLVPQEATWG